MNKIEFNQFIPVSFLGKLTQKGYRPLGVVFVILFLFCLFKGFYLVYDDLAFTYPFMEYDSYAWIANSYYYLGYDINITHRNLGLPSIFAVLFLIGIDNYYPILTLVLYIFFFIYLSCILLKLYNPRIVALTILLFSLNFYFFGYFDWIFADPWAVTFIVVALYYLYISKDDTKNLKYFSFFAGISFLFQYAIAFLSLAFIIYIMFCVYPRKKYKKKIGKDFIIAIVIGLAVVSVDLLRRWLVFDFDYHGPTQWPLINFHLFGLPFYGINYISFFSVPVAFIALYGMIRSISKKPIYILMNSCFVSCFIFWVLFYSWLEVRFISYFVPVIAFYFANGLLKLNFIKLTIKLNKRTYTKAVTIIFLIYMFLSVSSKKGYFLDASLIRIAPFAILDFSTRTIPKFEGNRMIDFKEMKVIFPSIKHILFGMFDHYIENKRNINLELSQKRHELLNIHELCLDQNSTSYTIKLCGSISKDHYSEMRRKIVFKRDSIQSCEKTANFSLYAVSDSTFKADVIFKGEYFKLVKHEN